MASLNDGTPTDEVPVTTCIYCGRDNFFLFCECLGTQLEIAVREWPRCENCFKVIPCTCNLQIVRIGLAKKASKNDNEPIAVSLPVPLFWVTATVNGNVYEGVPLRSVPGVLATEFLQTSGTVVKAVLGENAWTVIRRLDRFANSIKATHTSLVNLRNRKRIFYACRDLKMADHLATDFRIIMTRDSTHEEKKESFGKIAAFFREIGEFVLAFFCHDFTCVDFSPHLEQLLKLAIVAFFGIECKTEMNQCLDLVLHEIHCPNPDAKYSRKADDCRVSGNVLLAILSKQLSCFAVHPARKAFILNFLEPPARDDWVDPSELLIQAMTEPRAGPAAAPAEVVAVAAFQPEDELVESFLADRAALKELMRELGAERLESIISAKKRKTDDGDLAYLLHTDEDLEPGDTIFVLHDEANKLTCTKRQPPTGKKIFGQSVVAGACGLNPYMVASPHGLNADAAVEVVYLGHAFVKVHEGAKVEPGMWLCASDDGFAVPGNESSLHKVGKAIRRPKLCHDNQWMVEAFVFIGQGGNDIALAELSKEIKKLDLHFDGQVEELKEGQEFLSLAIDRLERDVREVKEKQEEQAEQLHEHALRLDTSEIRIGQTEVSVVKLSAEVEDLKAAGARGPSSRLELKSTLEAESSTVSAGNVIKGLKRGDSIPTLPETKSSMVVGGAVKAKDGAIISSACVVVYDSEDKDKKKKKKKKKKNHAKKNEEK